MCAAFFILTLTTACSNHYSDLRIAASVCGLVSEPSLFFELHAECSCSQLHSTPQIIEVRDAFDPSPPPPPSFPSAPAACQSEAKLLREQELHTQQRT